MEEMEMNKDFWRAKKVLITGHSGFKGAWLSLWLQSLGVELCGISLEPVTQPNLFDLSNVSEKMESHFFNICEYQKVKSVFENFKPDIVIHMAAQALVRYSYDNPIETYSTNVIGTVNILDAARKCDSVRAVLNVTTDKCYKNYSWVWGYRENDTLGGVDPYSNSKACSELATQAYRDSYFTDLQKGLATARAGNVIGGGDWSGDRIVPDLLNACLDNNEIVLRNPGAIRPWQHVLEPLAGYIQIVEKLYENWQDYSSAWNLGPFSTSHVSVKELTQQFIDEWGGEQKIRIADVTTNKYEANYLSLDICKALQKLVWKPKLSLRESIHLTASWYKAWDKGENMSSFTLQQIKAYEAM